MDLTTLITTCALTVDPKIMHALTWHQSGGEPWGFSVSGQHYPQVLKSMEDAVRAARNISQTLLSSGWSQWPPGHTAIRHGEDVHPMLQHRLARTPDRAARRVVQNLYRLERRPEPLRHCGLPRIVGAAR